MEYVAENKAIIKDRLLAYLLLGIEESITAIKGSIILESTFL